MTWLSIAAKHPSRINVITFNACNILKITKGCPPLSDAVTESANNCLMQILDLREIQRISGFLRMDFTKKQGLIGINIPNSRHSFLIEQHRFNRATRAL